MCVSDDGIAIRPTHASDVATVSFSDNRSQPRNVGVMRIPPPTPRKPDSSPAPSPITVHGNGRTRASVSTPALVIVVIPYPDTGSRGGRAAGGRDTRIAV